ncbi:HD domain-containing protein [Clostridioides difficile]|nr:phosphohydrolase [Clostridioides difficile]
MLSKTEIKYFNDCASEILSSEKVQLMRTFPHHGNVSCLEHSLSVAYYSYLLCKKLHLNVEIQSVIRGALLHDFFLYDWHYKGDRKGLHGFTHPKEALKNANLFFKINEKETDIILKHMWPLTVRPPRYKEALIVCLLDKFCCLVETLKIHSLLSPYHI